MKSKGNKNHEQDIQIALLVIASLQLIIEIIGMIIRLLE